MAKITKIAGQQKLFNLTDFHVQPGNYK
ncbi:hypothetical protein NTG1052_60048 [Candidatus Nitrotoga sp. 1052]|nr:hypothetical protein NTG1052_60048 [Candidatus Nitrotoga sp. 1052]